MDRTKHTTTSFVEEKNVPGHVNNPMFKTMNELNCGMYEVEKLKKKVKLDLPIQIGIAVYSYAKLRMLEFWEFINKFIVNECYQLMEMDTDSLYIAFSKKTIDECVKPDLRDQWEKEKGAWFSSSDTKATVNFDGQEISYVQWDKRTPGKFKAEFEGDGMMCLNSKLFIIWNNDEAKTSCKGTQKNRNEILKEHFRDVLETMEPKTVENAGFLKSRNFIKTYVQEKKGLGYFYPKRKVLSDGVSTTHLDI